ncbi:FtsX-like permease family protein [Anoxybacteroides rupiense]|uniref:FtsX-like permease family protein n=1 Tax=Anoxybacteroides rupiense TaxID=311460 RepID=UPI001F089992|nr:FtsX-like permease family protein [Anoxybacillus rupiensis]
MSINQIIFRSLRKNLKNYYLYVFALIFAVALYFSFVTLQYDPALNEMKGTVKGAAAIRAASVLLIAIVGVFLFYANAIFIKRRSKEIGLFQLIGMTKGKISRMLTAENFILYYSSLIIGIFIGFASSKLLLMILFKVTNIEAIATLSFSEKALVQTLVVFSVIYLFIMLMNRWFIQKQTILSLFRVTSTTEVKKVSVLEMLIGIFGLVLILTGYYVSSKLFDGDFATINELFLAMAFILGSVIIGTYFFFKGTVSFLFYLLRKRKGGYLNIGEVLSLSSLMFRMKSNALLLTIITTVSALAIGLLSLSYISYYSAGQTARNTVAADFSFMNQEDAKRFTEALKEKGIPYKEKVIDVIQVKADLTSILENVDSSILNVDLAAMPMPVIRDSDVETIDLPPDQTLFTGYQDYLAQFMPFKKSGQIQLKGKHEGIKLRYLGLEKTYYISYRFTYGFPTVIVDKTIFERLKKDIDPKIQKESTVYIGIHISDEEKVEKADDMFQTMNFHAPADSRLAIISNQKYQFGLIMFIVAFLGLTFLITSGCILYFKQMDEGQDEQPNYTILRKLGFTQGDLLSGIQGKQLFNFGIPLILGLSHSYFAVRSGWFFFGTELWMPMLTVMLVYTALYSIFGILSVLYYKKMIKEAL